MTRPVDPARSVACNFSCYLSQTVRVTFAPLRPFARECHFLWKDIMFLVHFPSQMVLWPPGRLPAARHRPEISLETPRQPPEISGRRPDTPSESPRRSPETPRHLPDTLQTPPETCQRSPRDPRTHSKDAQTPPDTRWIFLEIFLRIFL